MKIRLWLDHEHEHGRRALPLPNVDAGGWRPARAADPRSPAAPRCRTNTWPFWSGSRQPGRSGPLHFCACALHGRNPALRGCLATCKLFHAWHDTVANELICPTELYVPASRASGHACCIAITGAFPGSGSGTRRDAAAPFWQSRPFFSTADLQSQGRAVRFHGQQMQIVFTVQNTVLHLRRQKKNYMNVSART